MFSINIRPEELATFLLLFLFVGFFFYESREKKKRIEQGRESKTPIRRSRHPPPRPRLSRCVVFIT